MTDTAQILEKLARYRSQLLDVKLGDISRWPGGAVNAETLTGSKDDQAFLEGLKTLRAEIGKDFPLAQNNPTPIYVLQPIPDLDTGEALRHLAQNPISKGGAKLALNLSYMHTAFMNHGNITFGKPIWDALSTDEKLAVVAHEWGHRHDPKHGFGAMFQRIKELKPPPESPLQALYFLRECRADAFVPPRLRPALASALEKIRGHDPETYQAMLRLREQVHGTVFHPDISHRTARMRDPERLKIPGGAAIEKLRFDLQCNITENGLEPLRPLNTPEGDPALKHNHPGQVPN